MNKDKYLEELQRRDQGAPMVNRIYKKLCGHCGNDLTQPYNFCRFCGYRVKEDEPHE